MKIFMDFLKEFKCRLKNTSLITFITSWLIINYNVGFIVFSSSKNTDEKLMYLSSLKFEKYTDLIFPFLAVISYMYIIPLINLLLEKFKEKFINYHVSNFEREMLVDRYSEEAIEIERKRVRFELVRKEEELAFKLKELDYNKKINDYESVINERYKNFKEIETLKLHNDRLSAQIKSLEDEKKLYLDHKSSLKPCPDRELLESIKKIEKNKTNALSILKNNDNTRTDFSEVDLSGMNLNGFDFSYSDLSRANLSNSDLSNCIFYKSNLKNSNLSHSKLDNTDFKQSNLNNADLRMIKVDENSKPKFDDASLMGTQYTDHDSNLFDGNKLEAMSGESMKESLV
ncbi:pentapeptide repeat-containing protein [Vibrio campbellii]|uniref:Pentapeptide repeat-containing protein n=1 Tax=Vibrio campbellii TaxID=680 RepID=A0ABY5IF30_9VIBR|nr:pentapeptide repeat-containing protein [Vibrio campbellii]UTZ31499.1 pentapeptide repeat-containing protein [Vibrio campbellii]